MDRQMDGARETCAEPNLIKRNTKMSYDPVTIGKRGGGGVRPESLQWLIALNPIFYGLSDSVAPVEVNIIS